MKLLRLKQLKTTSRLPLFALIILTIGIVGYLIWDQNQTLSLDDKPVLDLSFDDKAPEGTKLQQEELCARGKCIFMTPQTTLSYPLPDEALAKSGFTLSFWLRNTHSADSGQASSKPSPLLTVKGNDGTLQLETTNQGKLKLSILNIKYLPAGRQGEIPNTLSIDSLEPSTWQQVTLVGTKEELRFYLNGSYQGSAKSNVQYSTFNTLSLGPMTGFLDELHLEPKALTDQQVIDDHANMLLYWRGEK